QYLAFSKPHANNSAANSFDAFHRRREANRDTMYAVLLFIESRKFFTRHASQNSGQGLQEGHATTEIGEYGGRLEPDVSSTDHHEPPPGGVEFAHDAVNVCLIAHRVHAR